MLEKIKNSIFFIFILYVLAFMALFICQTYKVDKISEERLESDSTNDIRQYINTGIEEIQNSNGYKNKNKCLIKVEKILKDERKKAYDSASTYREIYEAFDSYSYEQSNLKISDFSDMLEVCEVPQDGELRKNFASNYMLETALIESSFWSSYCYSYVLDLTLPNAPVELTNKPSFDVMLAQNKGDLRSRLVENQKNYIDNLLSVAGEYYE